MYQEPYCTQCQPNLLPTITSESIYLYSPYDSLSVHDRNGLLFYDTPYIIGHVLNCIVGFKSIIGHVVKCITGHVLKCNDMGLSLPCIILIHCVLNINISLYWSRQQY